MTYANMGRASSVKCGHMRTGGDDKEIANVRELVLFIFPIGFADALYGVMPNNKL